MLVDHSALIGPDASIRDLARDLLGRDTADAAAAAATDARATVVALAMILAEHVHGKDTWRGVDDWRGARPVATAELRYLAATGYTLADIEHVVTGDKQPEDIDLD